MAFGDPFDTNIKPLETPAEKKKREDEERIAAEIAAIKAQLAGSSNGRTRSTTTERSSSTSSDVTIYSLNQVRNVATSAFESALGRAPSQDELKTFLASLNEYSRVNPQVTTRSASGTTTSTDTDKSNKAGTKTTRTSTPVSSSTSSSTSSGGVDVAGFAAQQLENTTEARAVKVDDIFRGAMGFLANQIGG